MSISDKYFLKGLLKLIQHNDMSYTTFDDMMHHVLNVKYDIGLFRGPYMYLEPVSSNLLVDINVEKIIYICPRYIS